MEHLQRNPFLFPPEPLAGNGRCSASRVLSHRDYFLYNETNGSQDPKYMLITPGMNQNFRWVGNATEGQTNSGNFGNGSGQVTAQFSDEYPFDKDGNTQTSEADAFAYYRLKNQTNIVRWRLLQSGVRINFAQTATSLRGSYEACAIPMPKNTSLYKYQGGQNVFTFKCKPSTNPHTDVNLGDVNFVDFLNDIRMKDYPTFRSGPLSELNNATFSMRLHDEHNDFIEIPHEFCLGPYNDDNMAALSIRRRQLRWVLNTLGNRPEVLYDWWERVISKFYDNSFLMWVIRIHTPDKMQLRIESKHVTEVMYGTDRLELQNVEPRSVVNARAQGYEIAKERVHEMLEHPAEALDYSALKNDFEELVDVAIEDIKEQEKQDEEDAREEGVLVYNPIRTAKRLRRDIDDLEFGVAQGVRDAVIGTPDAHSDGAEDDMTVGDEDEAGDPVPMVTPSPKKRKRKDDDK